jgi:VanZ family protein
LTSQCPTLSPSCPPSSPACHFGSSIKAINPFVTAVYSGFYPSPASRPSPTPSYHSSSTHFGSYFAYGLVSRPTSPTPIAHHSSSHLLLS